MEQTFGQKRMNIPADIKCETAIDYVKENSARLIDIIYDIPVSEDATPEDVENFKRLKGLAFNHIESSALWVEKAVNIKS